MRAAVVDRKEAVSPSQHAHLVNPGLEDPHAVVLEIRDRTDVDLHCAFWATGFGRSSSFSFHS